MKENIAIVWRCKHVVNLDSIPIVILMVYPVPSTHTPKTPTGPIHPLNISSPPQSSQIASLTKSPSEPTQLSLQTPPPATHLYSHKSLSPRPTLPYLRRIPMRRDSGVGSERTRGCRGRGSVCIGLSERQRSASGNDHHKPASNHTPPSYCA